MTFEKYRGLIIVSDDFRSMGYCSRGIREGFARYELSYADFIVNGLDACEMLNAVNGNAMVLRTVEAAYERWRR